MQSFHLIASILIALLSNFLQVSEAKKAPNNVAVDHIIGLDCNEVTPCKALHENCKDGFCKCEDGYIRNEHHCFPERKYGETCFFDIQCAIHPMICVKEGQNGVRRCQCHRFYTWSEEHRSCILAQNVSTMISGLQEQTFTAEKIAAEAHHIFPGMVAAGILVLVLGAVLALGCVMYGCFWDQCGTQCRRPSTSEADIKLEGVTSTIATATTQQPTSSNIPV